MVDHGTLESIVGTSRATSQRGEIAVQAANRAGGETNITAVFFEIVEGDDTRVTSDVEQGPRRARRPPEPDSEDTPIPRTPPAAALARRRWSSRPPVAAALGEAGAEGEGEEEPSRARQGGPGALVIAALCVRSSCSSGGPRPLMQ
jgi:hypothetical protein